MLWMMSKCLQLPTSKISIRILASEDVYEVGHYALTVGSAAE